MSDTVIERVMLAMKGDLPDHLLSRFAKVDGGPFDGSEVITREAFIDAWAAFWSEFDLPIPEGQEAELKTPGTLTVGLECPECREFATGVTTVGSVLTDDGAKRTLKLRVGSVKVDHVHGQRQLPEDVVPGQEEAFDYKDIVGDRGEPQTPTDGMDRGEPTE